MASIYIPFLNPLRFVDKNKTNDSRYATKQFDDYLFAEQQQAWQEQVTYCQKYWIGDTIKLHFQADFNPIQISVIDSNGDIKLTYGVNSVLRDKFNPLNFIYEQTINLSTLLAGCYQVIIECGSPIVTTLISEKFDIVEDIAGSVLIEYNNSSFYGDVVFETGIIFSLRVDATISKMLPKSKDILYEDQVLNETMLNSRPYRLFKFVIGGTFGIPEWMVDKINWILGCNNVAIDGKYFTKNEGASLEPKEEENYPMAAYTIDLRETIRRSSSIFNPNIDPNKKLVLIGNIDSKGFGDLNNATANIIQIVDIE